jgi:hypothetical protein
VNLSVPEKERECRERRDDDCRIPTAYQPRRLDGCSTICTVPVCCAQEAGRPATTRALVATLGSDIVACPTWSTAT